ncbi:MAG: hypothetical protein JWP87_5706 [Labilithrix sp.]|nr:hypothetical protein [Labilithrix sp.]
MQPDYDRRVADVRRAIVFPPSPLALVFVLVLVLVSLSSSSCAEPRASGTSPPPTVAAAAAPPSPAVTRAPAPSSARPRAPLDGAAMFARLQPGLVRCFEQGKKSTPEMTDGKLTLNASLDAHGKPMCVIPSEHTGLTQEVEDCMSAHFLTTSFDDGAPPAAVVPVVIRAGAVKLGEPTSGAAKIESVETVRMPDAFDVLESLEPELQACVRSIDKSSGLTGLLVGARVGADGRAQCALATSSGPLPPAVSDCAAGVLRGAKFPPPKKGSGVVLVPIGLLR